MNVSNDCVGKSLVESQLAKLSDYDLQASERALKLSNEWLKRLGEDLCCVSIPVTELKWGKWWFKNKTVSKKLVIQSKSSTEYRNEICITIVLIEDTDYCRGNKIKFITSLGKMSEYFVSGYISRTGEKERNFTYEEGLKLICNEVASYTNNYNRRNKHLEVV